MSRISIFIYLCFLVGLDLGLKSLAINNFTQFETIPFLPFLNFYLTYNSGIAFSMFDFGPGASSYILLIIGLFFIFNPADAFISLGAILLITSELKMQKSNG